MKCIECGATIERDDVFCPECGILIEWKRVDLPEVPRKRSKKAAAMFAMLLLIAVSSIAIYIYFAKGKIEAYDSYMRLANMGMYDEAADGFKSLGRFRDSSEQALRCEEGIIYNSAALKYESGDIEGAYEDFKRVESFKDSKTYLDSIDYAAAEELEANGELVKAQAAYSALGSYRDSPSRSESLVAAIEKHNSESYSKASEDMASGRYSDAAAILASLGGYKDSVELLEQAQNGIEYERALTLFNNGLYYSARTAFRALGAFKDSEAQAQSCLRTVPSTSEIFRGDYRSQGYCQLKLLLPGSVSCNCFVKVYSEGQNLISGVFLRVGEECTISLPPGKYEIKVGYGSDWYGINEAFGQDGSYVILLNSGARQVSLDNGKLYTISLFTQGELSSISENMSLF